MCGTRHAQLGDLFFLLRDQRIELRDLEGVLPLLVLAEAEQIRLVLRPPAVEVQVVLGDDRLRAASRPGRTRGRGRASRPRPTRPRSAVATALPSMVRCTSTWAVRANASTVRRRCRAAVSGSRRAAYASVACRVRSGARLRDASRRPSPRRLDLDRATVPSRRQAERTLPGRGGSPVAGAVRWMPLSVSGVALRPVAERGRYRSTKIRPRLLRHVAHGVGVQAKVLVLRGRVGQRPAQVFLRSGDSSTMRALVGASASSSVFSPSTNCGSPAGAVERFVGAVADDDHGRLERRGRAP